MRYQNLSPFIKHLQNAYPHHLASAYLIVSANEYERNQIIDRVLEFLPAAKRARRFRGEFSIEKMLLEASSLSLFDNERWVVADFSKEISKKDGERLLAISGCRWIIGASSKHPLLSFFDKEGVVLDLFEEKKWDKEKRLLERLLERIKNGEKEIRPDVAASFLTMLQPELAFVDSECDKLITYVGDRLQITLEDITAITASSQLSTLWQVAEDMVYRKLSRKGFACIDAVAAPLFFSILRNELRNGYKIRLLLEKNEPLAPHFPKMWPKMLERKKELALGRDPSYFPRALTRLFSLELRYKNGSPPDLLFEIFYACN